MCGVGIANYEDNMQQKKTERDIQRYEKTCQGKIQTGSQVVFFLKKTYVLHNIKLYKYIPEHITCGSSF